VGTGRAEGQQGRMAQQAAAWRQAHADCKQQRQPAMCSDAAQCGCSWAPRGCPLWNIRPAQLEWPCVMPL
jgi:hypothetical protein